MPAQLQYIKGAITTILQLRLDSLTIFNPEKNFNYGAGAIRIFNGIKPLIIGKLAYQIQVLILMQNNVTDIRCSATDNWHCHEC